MLKTIINIFGRSPFAPLQSHMEKVDKCVQMIIPLFNALSAEDHHKLKTIAETMSNLEHEADLTKNDIRNHLPKSLFLPIDRSQLLEILTIQDSIADKSEDIAVLCTLKKLKMTETFKNDFKAFLDKNIETFNLVHQIIKEMHELLESSFGGIEAERVSGLCHDVAFKEHEADIIQRRLLAALLNSENELTYTEFYTWQKILEASGMISNLSEKLANRIRMTLELK